MSRAHSPGGLLLLVVLLLLASGCGDRAGGRQEISGTVTLRGQPLDQGMIEFHPLDNASLDQLVTKSGAMIHDGKWKTIEGCVADPDPALGRIEALEQKLGLKISDTAQE